MVLESVVANDMKNRKTRKRDWKTVRQLYGSSFPADEKVPFFFLKRKVMKNKRLPITVQPSAECLVAKDRDKTVGFVYTVCYEDLAYLLYLAVAKKDRGEGYGSRILSCMKERYAGKRIFLARERLEEQCNNMKQRVKRRHFYLKNGFEDLPCLIQEGPVVYDVMGTGGPVSASDYDALMTNWAGKLVKKVVYFSMTEK